MLIFKAFKSKIKSKKEIPGQLTSTPNGTGAITDTPDISAIELECSSGILLSAQSFEDWEPEYLNKLHVCPTYTKTATVQRVKSKVLHSNVDLRMPAPPQHLKRKHAGTQKLKPAYTTKVVKKMQNTKIVHKKPSPDFKSPTGNTSNTPKNSTKFAIAESKVIARSVSPFKENFAMQAFETVTKRTSPFRRPIHVCNKQTSPANRTQSVHNLNSKNVYPILSIPSYSCPNSPRTATRSIEEPIFGNGLTSKLKGVIGRITSPFATEAKLPKITCANTQARCYVNFTKEEIKAFKQPTMLRDVQELYFNNDMKSSDLHMKKDVGLIDYPAYIQPVVPCVNNETLIIAAPGQQSTISDTSGTGTTGTHEVKRLQQIQKQLVAAQLCLKDKEETVRVQADSLTCAEQRIAMLTLRAAQQRVQLETMQQEINNFQKAGQGQTTCKCRPLGSRFNTDECCQADSASEVEHQKSLVRTLQNNLMVIEELYAECFYETARQEELIEKLRQSCLDVRLMEKEKADRIGRLENVVNSQKWSLETCQGLAMEVDSLKTEILNFLNNSNNDSGMWEQSFVGEVGEDINDIIQQLHQLREILQDDTKDICVLKTEIENLKRENQCLDCKVQALCKEKNVLDYALKNKEETVASLQRQNDALREENDSLKSEKEENSNKLRIVEGQLQKANECASNMEKECDTVKKQLKATQGEFKEAKEELCRLRDTCCELQQKNDCLTEELNRADEIIKGDSKIRSEVQYLTQQVDLWRAQLSKSEERVRSGEVELQRVRSHCRAVDQSYRDKVEAVAALEAQLQEAHARGAQLCAESRRVVGTVRNWIRRMQSTNEKYCQKIKELESVISALQNKPRNHQMQQTSGHRCRPKSAERRVSCVFCMQTEPAPVRNADLPSTNQSMLSKAESAKYPAPRRPADPIRPASDESGDLVQVGCSKCAPKRNASQDFRSDVTEDYQEVGCSKCAPKRRNDTEDTESGSGHSHISHPRSSGCEREAAATQASDVIVMPFCSQTPIVPHRLLRKKLYDDRVTHFLRCTAHSARDACVQDRTCSDSSTSPPPSHLTCPPQPYPAHQACPLHQPGSQHQLGSRIPRALSPSSELMARVSQLNVAMEESQSRWARAKLTQPQRERWYTPTPRSRSTIV